MHTESGGRTAGRGSSPRSICLASLIAVHALAPLRPYLRAFNAPSDPSVKLAAPRSLVFDALGQRLVRFFDGEQCRRPTVNQPRG